MQVLIFSNMKMADWGQQSLKLQAKLAGITASAIIDAKHMDWKEAKRVPTTLRSSHDAPIHPIHQQGSELYRYLSPRVLEHGPTNLEGNPVSC